MVKKACPENDELSRERVLNERVRGRGQQDDG